MATDTMRYTGTLVVVSCCACGILFGVPRDLDDGNRNEPGRSFWCPSGHSQHYTGPSEAQKLRDELKRTRNHLENTQLARDAANERAEAAERRRRAAAGQVTRIKNRIANGICPCCKRTFADVAAHMATKHPAFAASADD